MWFIGPSHTSFIPPTKTETYTNYVQLPRLWWMLSRTGSLILNLIHLDTVFGSVWPVEPTQRYQQWIEPSSPSMTPCLLTLGEVHMWSMFQVPNAAWYGYIQAKKRFKRFAILDLPSNNDSSHLILPCIELTMEILTLVLHLFCWPLPLLGRQGLSVSTQLRSHPSRVRLKRSYMSLHYHMAPEKWPSQKGRIKSFKSSICGCDTSVQDLLIGTQWILNTQQD